MKELFKLFRIYKYVSNQGHLSLEVFDDKSGYVKMIGTSGKESKGKELFMFTSVKNCKKKLIKRIVQEL
jgi:hypothetical protein